MCFPLSAICSNKSDFRQCNLIVWRSSIKVKLKRGSVRHTSNWPSSKDVQQWKALDWLSFCYSAFCLFSAVVWLSFCSYGIYTLNGKSKSWSSGKNLNKLKPRRTIQLVVRTRQTKITLQVRNLIIPITESPVLQCNYLTSILPPPLKMESRPKVLYPFPFSLCKYGAR